MDELRQIKIEKLSFSDAVILSKLLNSAGREYSQYFIPFEFDQSSIAIILKQAKRDQYWGVYMSGQLAGFCMLRGFDLGYEIPSYGVWIAPQYSGLGLASLTLQYAVTFCRVNGIGKLMLKVHPKNIVAKTLYERSGFKAVGNDEKNGNLIYHKNIVKA